MSTGNAQNAESIRVVPAEHRFGALVRSELDGAPDTSTAAARIAAAHHAETDELQRRLQDASDETLFAIGESTRLFHMYNGAVETARFELQRRCEYQARLRAVEHVLGLVKGMTAGRGNVAVEDLRTVLQMAPPAPAFLPYIAYYLESNKYSHGHFRDRQGRAGTVLPFVGWGLVFNGPEEVSPNEPLFRVANGDMVPRTTLERRDGLTFEHMT